MNVGVLIGVKLTTDNLTTNELVTLTNAVSFDAFDFKELEFYEKIKTLLTESDTMHKETKEAIITLAGMRLQ